MFWILQVQGLILGTKPESIQEKYSLHICPFLSEAGLNRVLWSIFSRHNHTVDRVTFGDLIIRRILTRTEAGNDLKS